MVDGVPDDIYSLRSGAFVRASDSMISEAWKNQVGQIVSVVKGGKYLLTFDMDGDGSGFVEFIVQESGIDRDGDGLDWTVQTPQMRILANPAGSYHYEVVFVSKATDGTGRFWIQSGGLTNRNALDNLTLRKIGDARVQ